VGLGKRFDRAQIQGSPDCSSKQSTPHHQQQLATPSPGAAATPEQQQTSQPLQELAKYIPENIELDSAMMEHLARAAMELHHQRTGRKIQSDLEQHRSPPGNTLAWSEPEQAKVIELLNKGIKEPADIAKELASKTEAQVRAYLHNAKERTKGARILEAEMGVAGEEETPRKKGRGRKPPTTAMNTVPNAKLDIKLLLQGKGLSTA
jgi:hypothetical protein